MHCHQTGNGSPVNLKRIATPHVAPLCFGFQRTQVARAINVVFVFVSEAPWQPKCLHVKGRSPPREEEASFFAAMLSQASEHLSLTPPKRADNALAPIALAQELALTCSTKETGKSRTSRLSTIDYPRKIIFTTCLRKIDYR